MIRFNIDNVLIVLFISVVVAVFIDIEEEMTAILLLLQHLERPPVSWRSR